MRRMQEHSPARASGTRRRGTGPGGAGLPVLAVVAASLIPAALLGACASRPEPPPAVVQAPPAPPAPTLPEAPLPTALPPVSLAWSFDPAGETCQARATAPSASLAMLVRKGEAVSLTLAGGRGRALRSGAVPVSFRGAAGAWQVRGRAVGRPGRQSVSVAMPLDDRALGQVLALLGGGTVEVGGNRAGLPPLQLSPAGEAGRTWFECAKGKLLG